MSDAGGQSNSLHVPLPDKAPLTPTKPPNPDSAPQSAAATLLGQPAPVPTKIEQVDEDLYLRVYGDSSNYKGVKRGRDWHDFIGAFSRLKQGWRYAALAMLASFVLVFVTAYFTKTRTEDEIFSSMNSADAGSSASVQTVDRAKSLLSPLPPRIIATDVHASVKVPISTAYRDLKATSTTPDQHLPAVQKPVSLLKTNTLAEAAPTMPPAKEALRTVLPVTHSSVVPISAPIDFSLKPAQMEQRAQIDRQPSLVPAPVSPSEIAKPAVQLAGPAPAPSPQPDVTAPVAAKPLRQVMPGALPPGTLLFKDMAVQIKVLIDAEGRVTAAKPLTSAQKVSQSIIGVALLAAQQWQFQPAILHGHAQASEYIITFQFHSKGY